MTDGKTTHAPELRRKEGTNGICKIGGNSDSLIFLEMPFYDRKDKSINEDDYDHLRNFIKRQSPDSIYICADLFDPNRTHLKCYDLLCNILINEKNPEFDNIHVYFYFSVWYYPGQLEYSHILPYDYETYVAKVNAMFEHKSQMKTHYMGFDKRPFYQRVMLRDQIIGEENQCEFCEIFYKVK